MTTLVDSAIKKKCHMLEFPVQRTGTFPSKNNYQCYYLGVRYSLLRF
jgi:hypothetical protein